ncbi:hypothetical protein [Desulfotruncus alcoholivorax]|uniref:hypothetical protein n=1 Tax=Desulfotruncus alcoholivorax TaxID=265477 RepID=UPI0003F79287|nr:hypothetical protein [Desulfotruncus alcoholivorax]
MKNPKFLIAATSLLCVIGISLLLLINNAGPGGSDLTKNYHGMTNPAGEPGSSGAPGTFQGGAGIDLLPGPGDLSQLGSGVEQEKYKAILLKYTALFSNLQSEYTGKLNNLLKRAQVDVKNSGGQKKEVIKIAYRCITEAKALEKECDAKFYGILSDMENELKQGHFPLDVVDEAESQYRQQKKEREHYLRARATEYIKRNN